MVKKVKLAFEPSGQAGAYPGFCNMRRLRVFLPPLPPPPPPLDEMLLYRRVTPSSKFAGTHLYTRVKRGTVRVKFLVQEHNGVQRTNH